MSNEDAIGHRGSLAMHSFQLICRRHQRWIGYSPSRQLDLRALPHVLRASRRHHALAHLYGFAEVDHAYQDASRAYLKRWFDDHRDRDHIWELIVRVRHGERRPIGRWDSALEAAMYPPIIALCALMLHRRYGGHLYEKGATSPTHIEYIRRHVAPEYDEEHLGPYNVDPLVALLRPTARRFDARTTTATCWHLRRAHPKAALLS